MGVGETDPSAIGVMEAYTQLRTLGAAGLRLKPLPQAAAYVQQQGIEAEAPSPGLDLDFWEQSQARPDPLPLLCLRCRLSDPLHQWLQALLRRHGQQHELEPTAIAAYLLDDDGSLQIPWPTEPPSRQSFTHALLASAGPAPLHPFSAEVLRSWDPRCSSLPNWGRERAQSHPPLKAYLRDSGLLLITDWALLADSSPKRVAEVWESFGGGSLSTAQAVALHGRYRELYRTAKAAHRQATGRISGWRPDSTFLLSLAPDQPVTETRQQLEAIARAIRLLQSGQWQRSEVGDPDLELDRRQAAGQFDAVSNDAEAPDGEQLRAQIDAALQRAMDQLLPAELAAEQKRFSKAPEKQRAWQLYGEGLSQREIAARCDHKQAWVSKQLDEKRRATAIATAAAAELVRLPAFHSCTASPQAATRLHEALRNHLVEPEQEGCVAPLRLWIQQNLQTP